MTCSSNAVAIMDNWLFSMNSPHQTIYLLTWRRILLRRIGANNVSLPECRSGADGIESQ